MGMGSRLPDFRATDEVAVLLREAKDVDVVCKRHGATRLDLADLRRELARARMYRRRLIYRTKPNPR